MTGSPLTLDQLAELVGAALSVGYDGQVSRRVREVPDQRAIRYYTTIGLVDRPAAMRGRTALYARRHLLQLVAIKRLQASGLSLAQIQRELAGATDAQLERVARGPPLDEPAGAALDEEAAPAAAAPAATRSAFWKRAGQPPAPPRRFRGAAPTSAEAAEGSGDAAVGRPAPAADFRAAPEPTWAPVAASSAEPGGAPAPAVAGVVAMQGLRLGDGVTLLVERARPLGADEVAAIRAAAGPLLGALRRGRERS